MIVVINRSSKAAELMKYIGTITGIVTLFPYQQWKNSHAIHHATSSNLDKRGTGDMWVLTVDEYAASPLCAELPIGYIGIRLSCLDLVPSFYSYLQIALIRKVRNVRKESILT